MATHRFIPVLVTCIGLASIGAWEYTSRHAETMDDFSNFVTAKQRQVQKEGLDMQPSPTADLNHNDINEEYGILLGVLTIREGERVLWTSPRTWWIDSVVIGDTTRDGIADINLSVWKSGNFGPSKPFWVHDNDMSIKNHLFVMDLVADHITPIWQSSNLEVPNCALRIQKNDRDGTNDLTAIEGSYADAPECIGRHTALWQWNGWGFSNAWRK